MMAGAFAIHVLIVAYLKPEVAPALPASVRIRGKKLWTRMVTVMLPPLLLIMIILGSIFMGIATPTEAGALGSVGTIILAAINRQLSWAALREVCDATMRITTMVMFILIGSTAFSLVFRGLGGDRFMQHLLVNLPGGTAGFLLVNMLVIFLLGFFIDFFEIAFIVIPIFAPVAQQLGLDLVWYGVVIGANLQTSFLTPPFGFALFYLQGVAPPELTTEDIYRGAVPFILLQLLVLTLIIIFSQIVSFLPSLSSS
jgi:tripartite ATP-independent transporter DctM subunit